MGIPKFAANESFFLLTGLLPLSREVYTCISTLLLIGQLLRLDHHRYEFRAFLQALSEPTPLLVNWSNLLVLYNLPSFACLVSNDFNYASWKLRCRRSVCDVHLQGELDAI